MLVEQFIMIFHLTQEKYVASRRVTRMLDYITIEVAQGWWQKKRKNTLRERQRATPMLAGEHLPYAVAGLYSRGPTPLLCGVYFACVTSFAWCNRLWGGNVVERLPRGHVSATRRLLKRGHAQKRACVRSVSCKRTSTPCTMSRWPLTL